MRGRASLTAEGVCLLRSLAGVDPLAKQLLDATSRVLHVIPRSNRLLNIATGTLLATIAARTRYFDGVVEAALAQGAEALVLLGAGLDARPWRLSLGARPAYLVDHPLTAALRAQRTRVLPSRPQDVRVDVDFSVDHFADRLRAGGFDDTRPAVFVWEGVSMYLPEAAVKKTLIDLAGLAAPGSCLVLDLWSDAGLLGQVSHRLGSMGLGLLGEPLRFAVHRDQVGELLGRAGFQLERVTSAYGQSRKGALGPGLPGLLFASARRSFAAPSCAEAVQ